MNLIALSILIGTLVFAGLLTAAYAIFKRVANLQERVHDPQELRRRNGRWAGLFARMEKVFKPMGEVIPRSPEEMSKQEKRLVQAGIRRKDAVGLFYGAQVSLALFLLLALSAAGIHPFYLTAILAIFLGMLAPDVWLRRKTNIRRERIQLALPDALDLLVVCVEAGLGLDQALARISAEIKVAHPELSDELHVRNLEVNVGRTRADAFRNLAMRAGVDDLRALVAVLIQTDRFGTSIGQSLRVFSDSLRTKRRQRAEERAAKLAVKMVPPMICCIFPAMFVAIVGPAFIAIVRELVPLLHEAAK